MRVDKTKSYNIFSFARLKNHCNIADDNSSFDGMLKFNLSAAVDYCENYTHMAIAPTTCVLEDDNYLTEFTFINYRLYDINAVVSGITVYDYNNNPTVVSPSLYRVEKFSNFTNIFFNPSITGYKLQIVYTTGYQTNASIPFAIQQAINTVAANFFQGDRQGLLPTNVTQTGLAERLLSPYVNL